MFFNLGICWFSQFFYSLKIFTLWRCHQGLWQLWQAFSLFSNIYELKINWLSQHELIMCVSVCCSWTRIVSSKYCVSFHKYRSILWRYTVCMSAQRQEKLHSCNGKRAFMHFKRAQYKSCFNTGKRQFYLRAPTTEQRAEITTCVLIFTYFKKNT